MEKYRYLYTLSQFHGSPCKYVRRNTRVRTYHRARCEMFYFRERYRAPSNSVRLKYDALRTIMRLKRATRFFSLFAAGPHPPPTGVYRVCPRERSEIIATRWTITGARGINNE